MQILSSHNDKTHYILITIWLDESSKLLGFHLKLHPGIWYTHAGGSICYPPVLIGHRYSASPDDTNRTSECERQPTVHGGESDAIKSPFILFYHSFHYFTHLLAPPSSSLTALHCIYYGWRHQVWRTWNSNILEVRGTGDILWISVQDFTGYRIYGKHYTVLCHEYSVKMNSFKITMWDVGCGMDSRNDNFYFLQVYLC